MMDLSREDYSFFVRNKCHECGVEYLLAFKKDTRVKIDEKTPVKCVICGHSWFLCEKVKFNVHNLSYAKSAKNDSLEVKE